MTFLDSHVHLYGEFDLDVLFSCFMASARRAAPGADAYAMAVMLRSFQPSLGDALHASPVRDWKLEESAAGTFTASRGDDRITILPARQVAAAERIEALGLFGEAMVPDGLPLSETITRLREASFTPVLAWGLGKWLFSRSRMVNSVLNDAIASGDSLLIGDSALRPVFWLEPCQYRVARAHGIRVLHGSDPLPRPGQERRAGSYGSVIEADLDADAPAESLMSAILDASKTIRPVGGRCLLPV